MPQKLNFWVVGGDPRQAALANALAGDGHSVHTYALDQGVDPGLPAPSLDRVREADCVLLPLPVNQGENLNAPLSDLTLSMDQVLDALAPGTLVLAGMVTPALREAAAGRDLRLIDYFAREELAVANAVPAALSVWSSSEQGPHSPPAPLTGRGWPYDPAR